MKRESEAILVIDIDSGSTGAATIRTHREGVPELVSSARNPFILPDRPTPESMKSAMLASLKLSLSETVSKLGGPAHIALVTLSSPWLSTHQKTVVVENGKGFVFDRSMINKIIAEEAELFATMLKETFTEDSEIFEAAITNLYLNGYEVPGPMKEKVKKAEVSFILSATTKELLRNIEDEIIRAVGVKKGVMYQSFMFAFFKVLSHSYQNLHSALLINMSSEITDILFLRNGVSAHNATLPFGPTSVARTLSAKLAIPLEVAYSYLTVFASQEFDSETTSLIDQTLLAVEDEWKRLWQTMGESIPQGKDVPYAVFLVVPRGFEAFVKTFLESVLPGRSIIVLGEGNAFSRQLVKTEPDEVFDEKFYILASFSNLIG